MMSLIQKHTKSKIVKKAEIGLEYLMVNHLCFMTRIKKDINITTQVFKTLMKYMKFNKKTEFLIRNLKTIMVTTNKTI